MLKTLKRIVYQSPDIQKAKEWYAGLLGKQPIFEAPVAAIFMVGDCSLSITLAKSPRQEPDRMEVYWEVDDIEAAYQRLLDAGATSVAPVTAVLNIRTAKVMDPFGNVIGLTGMAAEKKTVEQAPSETARTVAFCRALAAKEDREEIKGPDYLAELFLSEEHKKLLQDAAARRWVIDNRLTAQLYGYFLARTAWLDGVFKKALAENIPQIVFLGAGYDTRAFRCAGEIKGSHIFEMDIQTTQQRKIALLKNANVPIPAQLTFVSINFTTKNLAEVLAKAGYNPALKALFIWEGVTYYLPEDAVRGTLSFVKSQSPGSRLCFDYMTEKTDSVVAGEPFRFWIGPDKIGAFLENYSLKIAEHLDAGEMGKRFLALKDGRPAEKALARFCFVEAVLLV